VVSILTDPEQQARKLLFACCGSSRWVQGMIDQRPFASQAELQRAAAQAFEGLSRHDWLEAFSAHPRIGEREAAVPSGPRADAWSAAEQAESARANDDTRAALADAGRAYEERFGHIYLVAAAGRTAEELLADCLARMANDPETELQVAAAEQQRITSLRLARLMESPS
jgi:OHCU decarboxylase